MANMLRYYRFLTYLNLDIVAGALICTSFAEKILNVAQPTFYLNMCLGLSIWVVYTFDRLMDIRKELKQPGHRHIFHQRYHRPLWVFTMLALIADIYVALTQLTNPVLEFGIYVVAGVMIYFIFLNMLGERKRIFFQKEPIIALIYTIGVWGSKWWLSGVFTGRVFFLLILPFYLLALMNLLIFSYFESEKDAANGEYSIITWLGTEATGRIVQVLFALILTLNVTLLRLEATPQNLMIAITRTVMAFVLFIVFYRSEWFYKDERYRLLGDATFLIPAIPLLTYF